MDECQKYLIDSVGVVRETARRLEEKHVQHNESV